MNKAEFAKKLSAKTQLNEEQAAQFIEAFGQTLGDFFTQGEKVVIAEFGSFYVKDDKTVQFNPSAKLKELVG